MTKGIVWYSDGLPDSRILTASIATVLRTSWPIAFVPLGETRSGQVLIEYLREIEDLGGGLIHVVLSDWHRGHLTMFRQILAGLEALKSDVAFLCEHDVLYAPDHFRFTPTRADVFYYNAHVWKVDAATGRALHYRCNQTSGLCASRELLVQHYRERVRRVEAEGYSTRIGFEPGTHNRPERIDDYGHESWMAAVPNVDIRHDKNLTKSRWSKTEFRDQRYTEGWTEASAVPGWPGMTLGRFDDWLREAVAWPRMSGNTFENWSGVACP